MYKQEKEREKVKQERQRPFARNSNMQYTAQVGKR